MSRNMNYRIALTVILCCLLSACSGTKKPPRPTNINATDASLAEASYAVSRSVADLAETAEAAHPSQTTLLHHRHQLRMAWAA